MSKYTDPPLAKSTRRPPSAKRKGHQVYLYIQEVLGATLLVSFLLVAARVMGWADTTNDPLLANMINDDGAVWRAAGLICVLVALLFVVGKPKDNNPRFTASWRTFGVFFCCAFVALVAWWGWMR